jgi:hypothetical protein
VALPSSRVPPVKTCPALRPRWCPAHSPRRTQDCCLPATENRRLTTTLSISGLHHAAYLLATPGSVRPLTGRHAGSLLTCWLGFNQVGFAPWSAHLLGNNNQFHGLAPSPKVSGLPWRDQWLIRQLEEQMIVLSDTGFHAAEGDPANLKLCPRGEWEDRMLVETVLSMLTLVCHLKKVMHRGWAYFQARLVFTMAAFCWSGGMAYSPTCLALCPSR